MEKCDVSIIIPVYNTAPYLEECIDSVINQTKRNIEIICIDDGSTDGSDRILDEYAKKNNRVKVLHKDNEGVVRARKTGVKMASAEIIGFVDSDDWIEPNMIEILYEEMISEKVDMVSSGIIRGKSKQYDGAEERIYKAAEEKREFFKEMIMLENEESDVIYPYIVTKLYRKKILLETIRDIDDGIRFREDDCLVYSYIVQCDSFSIIKEAFYHYRIHEASNSFRVDDYYLTRLNSVYLFLRKKFSECIYKDVLLPQLEIYIIKSFILGVNVFMGFGCNAFVQERYPYMELKQDKKIVIYGAGNYGKRLYEKICKEGEKEVIAILDQTKEWLGDKKVLRPEEIKGLEYDSILIAIKNKDIVDAVKEKLMSLGVSEDKMVNIWV